MGAGERRALPAPVPTRSSSRPRPWSSWPTRPHPSSTPGGRPSPARRAAPAARRGGGGLRRPRIMGPLPGIGRVGRHRPRPRSRPGGRRPPPPPRRGPNPSITVAFVPAKGDRPEWVVQKLTELGVDRIVPIRSRSVGGAMGGGPGPPGRRPAAQGGPRGVGPVPPGVVARGHRRDHGGGLAAPAGAPPALAHPGGAPPSLSRPVVAIGPEGGWDDDELHPLGRHRGLGADRAPGRDRGRRRRAPFCAVSAVAWL